MSKKFEFVVVFFAGIALGVTVGSAFSSGDESALKTAAETSKAALTPVIALLAAYIAYRQMQGDQDRRRVELYDRRLGVYKAVVEFVFQAFRNGRLTNDDFRSLYQGTTEGYFLFGDDFEAYIKELTQKGARLESAYTTLNAGSVEGDELERLSEEKSKLMEWFANQPAESKRRFSKQLRLI